MYPTFLSLSPELVLSICDKLPLSDLKQLRLSCKAIGRITDSLVLRNLRISAVETASLDESISYLQSLAQSPVRYIAQDIFIGDLSSLSPSSSDTNDSNNVKRSSVPRNLKRKIRELLMEALASLKEVRRVSWHSNQKDCLWIQETIWSVIQLFPALRYLYIDAQFLQFTPTFKAFTTLESISISALEASSLYTNLSKLYASCSTLTSIAISDSSGRRLLTKANSVEQIFLGCSKNVPSGRLRRLCLHDCFVHIDKFTLPHLRQLTSLELICVQYTPYPWSTFIGSGIQLEELVHNTITDSLIDYLSSYSGLKKLWLSVSPFMDTSPSDQAATRFFNNVLSRHVETLESLSVKAYYEGEWCFTSQNAGVISQCTKLNHLLMGITSAKNSRDSDSVENDDEFDGNEVENPNVKHLLDTVIQLPLMTHLSLTVASPEYSRFGGCGTGRIKHLWTTRAEIRMNVTNYRPPPSCSYLPRVEVNGMFEGIRDSMDGRLRYVVESDLKKPTHTN